MNKLMKFSCIVMFCLCVNNILYAQSEPVPYWYNNRNSLKDGDNFAYAVGVGEGSTSDKAKEKALDAAIKEAIQYLRSVNIAEADIDSRMLKVRMNDNSNASWRTICVKGFKVENNNSMHKVYILCRFKKDIYKDMGDKDAYIDCDDSFERKLDDYLRNFYVGIAKTAEPTQIGESYSSKIVSEKPSDFEIVIPKDGNLILSLESFAENTWFTLYNEDGVSFSPTSVNIASGQKAIYGYGYLHGLDESVFSLNDKVQSYYWNSTVEKFKGSFTFKLDAGTYYFRITRSQTGLSNINLSIQFKALR